MTLHLTNARMPGERGLLGNIINIAVDDGVITALDFVGQTTAIALPTVTQMTRALNGEDEVIDLAGRWVIPGLWDSHVHFGQWALNRTRLDVSGAHTLGALAELAGAHAASGMRPVVGYGWRPAEVTEHPQRALLDAATGDVPTYLFAVGMHTVWMNSAAFAAQCITPVETGILVEDACFAAAQAVTQLDDDDLDRLVDEAAREAARRGVVGIVDFERAWNPSAWRRRIGKGTDVLRVDLAIYPEDLERAIEAGLRTGDAVASTDGLLQVGPLKVIVDGSLGSQTARCFEAYPGATGPAARGLLNLPLPDLAAVMGRGWSAGLEIAAHVIGDEAVSVALDAFEAVECEGTLEHAQLVRPEDIQRMVELGLRASVQPAHLVDDRDVAERLWAGRTEQAFPLGQLHDARVPMAFGSDAPVTPLDPWLSIAAAVGRTGDTRPAWHESECLTIEQAIRCSVRSHLAVGQRADLAIVEFDPLEATRDELATMPVAATFLAGRPTHLTL